jgi:hypothetical protein
MDTKYDVSEILINRSVKWHLCIREKQRALDMLKAVGTRTFNECFATNLETQEIIGRVNERSLAPQSVISGDGLPSSWPFVGRP